jgi:hypothetical protein
LKPLSSREIVTTAEPDGLSLAMIADKLPVNDRRRAQ